MCVYVVATDLILLKVNEQTLLDFVFVGLDLSNEYLQPISNANPMNIFSIFIDIVFFFLRLRYIFFNVHTLKHKYLVCFFFLINIEISTMNTSQNENFFSQKHNMISWYGRTIKIFEISTDLYHPLDSISESE